MTVRAKFICLRVIKEKGSRPVPGCEVDPQAGPKEYESCISHSVELMPVFTGYEGENFKFWSATPSGKLEMMVMNQPAGEQFQPGKSYYVDFTPAD